MDTNLYFYYKRKLEQFSHKQKKEVFRAKQLLDLLFNTESKGLSIEQQKQYCDYMQELGDIIRALEVGEQ